MKNGIRRLLMAVLTLALVFAVTVQAGAETDWTKTTPEVIGHYRIEIPEDWSVFDTGDDGYAWYQQTPDGDVSLLMVQQLDIHHQLLTAEMFMNNYLTTHKDFTALGNGVEKLEIRGLDNAFVTGLNEQGNFCCILLVQDDDCSLLCYFMGSFPKVKEDALAYARGISLASEPENGTGASADGLQAQIPGTWRSNILPHYTLCFYEDGMMVEDMDGDTSKAIWYEENGGWYLYYPIEKETYQILLTDSQTMVLKDLATQVDYTFIKE